MTDPSSPAVQMNGVVKQFTALRPLRIAALSVAGGERVSIAGIEAGVSELLVNLVTGASLPDSGEVRVFGRPTSEIADSEDWLEWLERFGIVSPRGVLLEGSTLLQNLAMPFTLAIDPVAPDVERRVRDLAAQCGIDPDRWCGVRAGELPAPIRVRAHLARALALDPALLLVEHPTADVEAASRAPLAADVARVCAARRLTTIVLTNDEAFAAAAAPRNLRLSPASGELKPVRKGWFSRS